MELSNVERMLPPRPQAHGVGLAVPGKLQPDLPVPEGVINEINPQVQALASRAAGADPQPAQPASPEFAAKPVPLEPLSKVLMAHFHSVWSASSRVVERVLPANADKNLLQIQMQMQAQAQARNVDPAATPGTLAKATLTYSPSKIKPVDPV